MMTAEQMLQRINALEKRLEAIEGSMITPSMPSMVDNAKNMMSKMPAVKVDEMGRLWVKRS